MQFNVEYTDTFGGEANYAWVRRATFEAPVETSDRVLMRRAKKLMGLSGTRGVSTKLGDTLEFHPHRTCAVLFVTFE